MESKHMFNVSKNRFIDNITLPLTALMFVGALSFCSIEIALADDYDGETSRLRENIIQYGDSGFGRGMLYRAFSMCYNGKDADGNQIEPNKTEALKYLIMQADKGDANAQYSVGEFCWYGEVVKQNKKEAIKWFRDAAEKGDTIYDLHNAFTEYCSREPHQSTAAQFMLLKCYWNGDGVQQNRREAAKYFAKLCQSARKSDCRVSEHGDARVALGDCYYYGIGADQDKAMAIQWYRKALEWNKLHYDSYNSSNGRAEFRLGEICYNGDGIVQDKTKARKWFRKAAAQSDHGDNGNNAQAQLSLGKIYYNGDGVKRDTTEAIKWFRKAAKHTEGVLFLGSEEINAGAEAEFTLGKIYYNGDGVKQDKAEATEWFNKASEHGNDEVKRFLNDSAIN